VCRLFNGPVLILLIQVGVSCKWIDDSQHLLLENFDAIQNSPSHLYYCGLPLSPSSSWLHKYYGAELSQGVKVVKGLQAGWGTCSRTVTLDDCPLALACWKDIIAVGMKSSNIIILDVITGSQVAVLSGHTDWVGSLTFTLDGISIVSGSSDTTLKLWDVQTGGVVRTFQGHTSQVYSISVSSDCTTIASGSYDETIRLWDIQTGECHCIMEQQNSVDSVTFSPRDPHCLVSVSGGVVQQWDTDGHQIKHTCKGSYAAFSLDGSHLTLSGGEVATIQDSGSGVTVATYSVPKGRLCYCCFSPNGRLIAAATTTTAYIWDITGPDPHLINTLIGHADYILSLTFSSSSLISASSDQSVKFWQVGVSSTDLATSDPKSTPLASTPIKSVTLQAKDGIAISSDSDGVVRIWDLSTGHCRVSFQTPAKGSHQRDVRLVNQRLILVWCTDKKLYIQDIEEGKLLKIGYASRHGLLAIQISGDGSKVFCLDQDYIQAWFVQTGEVVGSVYHRCPVPQGALLTTSGSRVWVSTDGWDFGTLNSSSIPRASPDSPRLDFVGGVREFKTDLPEIEDTVTGKEVFRPPARFMNPSDSQWDGQYLVAGYENGEVLILDFNNILL
jgi:WD40 repeat protein